MPQALEETPDDVVAALSRPGPRYTSYPTADRFAPAFGPEDHARALAAVGAGGGPLGLYVHLPFCRQLCHYCACNVVVTRSTSAAGEYLGLLAREAELVAGALGGRLPVAHLHLGGGTPTFFTPAELERLHALLTRWFDLGALAEAAVEADPRVTTREHLAALAGCGFDRLSVGVQDFDEGVQVRIGRMQSVEQTRRVLEDARALGFRGANVDLVYGLPGQTEASLARTLAVVTEVLAPDRVALFSYAHVPWLRPAQRKFERGGAAPPGPLEKVRLLRRAARALVDAGWVAVGMDHFARPDDALARAAAEGRLRRDFQGYGPEHARALVGLGVTAISELDRAYAQNERDLAAWSAALEAGRLPVARGLWLGEDDARRRAAIRAVMTGAPLREAVDDYPGARAALEPLEALGLVRLDAPAPGGLEVTPRGRWFVRNVAMAFDAHLPSAAAAPGPRFSQTV